MEHSQNLIVLTIGLLVLTSCSRSEGNGPQTRNKNQDTLPCIV